MTRMPERISGSMFGELILCENNCFATAFFNNQNSYKHLNLHLVVGHLGLKMDEKSYFWEFGNPEWRMLEQFMVHGRIDAHVWLEDDRGNVYDVISRHLLMVVKLRKLRCEIQTVTPIECWSKDRCNSVGISYVAASPLLQQHLLRKFMDIVMK